MVKDIQSLEGFNKVIQSNTAVLVYFSHDKCNVCKVLKPKVFRLIETDFPEIKLFYSNTVDYPEVAAQNSVFTVPTILIFLEGKEYLRKSRNIGVEELRKKIERPYKIMFE